MAGKPLVVVLGASGYVASALVPALARRAIRLRLVARRPCAVPAGATAEIEARSADLTIGGDLSAAVADADAVVHLVALIAGDSGWRRSDGDRFSERVNVGVVQDLIAACRATRRGALPPVVVSAGSTSQVGARAARWIDGTEPDQPATAYDRQKLAAERALKAATAEGVLRAVTVRLPTVFGCAPLSRTIGRGVVAAMARRAIAGEPLTIWHDGLVERDLLYVDDAARALLAGLDHADALAGRHWLAGTGHPVRLADLFAAIAETVSLHTGRPPVPVVSVPPPEQAASTDFRSVAVDPSAFRSVTGWSARVPLREGLRRTVAAMT